MDEVSLTLPGLPLMMIALRKEGGRGEGGGREGGGREKRREMKGGWEEGREEGR